MKKTTLILTVLIGLFLVSCGGKKENKEESNLPAPRNNGHFLMYYYPTHSMYSSEFGTEFTKADTCIGYPSCITADEAGTLYSSINGSNVSVSVSKDGGKTWNIVENPDETVYENASFALVAGKANTVYALSTRGDFFVTKDGGASWEKKTSPCLKDTTHSSPAFSSSLNLAVSVDGKKLIAQGWYFEETVLAISEDDGATWTAITPPTERNESKGVGFCADRIIYASYDQIFYTDDLGKTWLVSEPEKLFSKDSERSFYGYRTFVTDGDKFVMGVEAPAADDSRDDKNKFPGAIFLSIDGGKTFKTYDFPFSTDQTPEVSDEYIYLTFVPKK
jgi:hypothetical protein